jgi:hypothetical protein
VQGAVPTTEYASCQLLHAVCPEEVAPIPQQVQPALMPIVAINMVFSNNNNNSNIINGYEDWLEFVEQLEQSLAIVGTVAVAVAVVVAAV